MSVLMSLREPFLRGEVYHYEINRQRRSLRTKDRTEAMRLFNEIKRQYLNGKLSSIAGTCAKPLGEFVDDVLEWANNSRPMNTWKSWRTACTHLEGVAGKSARLDRIGHKQWDGIVSEAKRRGYKPKSINTYLLNLRCVFNKAMEWGYLQKNPFATCKKLREEKRPPSFIDPKDIPRFLASIKDIEVRRVTAAAIFTGRRIGELLGLQWEDMDIAAESYAATIYKTSLRRRFPMHPLFKSVLEAMPAGSGRVFSRWSSPCALSRTIRRAALVPGGYGHLRPHDLRHTFASMVILSGNELKIAQELLAHNDYRSTLIYAHLTDDSLAAGLRKIKVGPVDLCGQIADTPRKDAGKTPHDK